MAQATVSTTQTCPSEGIRFYAPDAEIDAGRDIGCGNINGQNIHSTVKNYHGASELASGSLRDDIVNNVISWLNPFAVDYFPAHEKARSERAEDTGKWFLNAMKYKMWVTIGLGKYRNLECVGIPGAGKTTMASTVIKALQDSFLAKLGLDIVLYAYFRHDTQSTQSISFVLASLLLQIIKHKGKVSAGIRKFYHEYSSRENIPPAIDAMIELIRSELSGFSRAYIIVDALDEFSLPDYSPSFALVEKLQRLEARLLVTSRYAVGFVPNMFSTLLISAHIDDIRIFVRKHMSGHLATVLARTPGLLEEIVRAVIIKSAGMFIVARLLVSCIPNSQLMTANDLRAVVRDLPTGIQDTYKMAMIRIQEQEPHLAELGKQALYWVYFSRRRLTVTELRHALSFQRCKVISKDDLIGEDRILSACAGLISFVKLKNKPKTMECQFSHFTTREFLDESWQKFFLDGERQITETCLGYLAAAATAVPPDVTMKARAKSWRNDVWTQYCQDRGLGLCRYALDYWGGHARAIDETFDLAAGTRFFRHPISLDTADSTDPLFPTNCLAPEHFWMLYFARFGFLKLLQEHTDSAFAVQSHNTSHKVFVNYVYSVVRGQANWTALHFSSFGGHSKVVEFLLDNGMDINMLDISLRSPLHFAVQGQAGPPGVATVQLLLDRGAIADRPDCVGRAPISYAIKPLSWASIAPSPSIIRLLLQHEVDIYRIDEEGESPLSRARKSETPEIKQLLEEYALAHPPKCRYEQCLE